MGDAGGHGGASYSEIMTSLMIVSDIFGQNPSAPPSRLKPTMVHQVDLASTLAILTGIEIPNKNVGQPIQEVLKYLPINRQLAAHYKISRQLLRASQGHESNEDFKEASEFCMNATLLHDNILKKEDQREVSSLQDVRDAIRLYERCHGTLSCRLKEKENSYDTNLIGLSAFLLILIFFLNIIRMAAFGASNPELDTTSGMALLLLGSLIILLIFEIVPVFLTFIFIFALIVFKCLRLFRFYHQDFFKNVPKLTLWNFYLIFVIIFHPLSLVSSSYVEEEHQTHYFITSVSHFLLLFSTLKKLHSTTTSFHLKARIQGESECQLSPDQKPTRPCSYFAGFVRSFKKFFSTCHSCVQDGRISELHTHATSFVRVSLVLLSWFLFRTMRSFNATGDKWKHLQDVNDLIRRMGPFALSLSALSGSFIFYYIFYSYGSLIVLLILTAIYWRHSFSVDQPKLGIAESQVAYLLIFILFIRGVFKAVYRSFSPGQKPEISVDIPSSNEDNSSSSILLRYILTCFSLLFLLLQRPENILLTSLSFLQLRLFLPVLLQEPTSDFGAYLALWLSQAHFFTQGNSNSLTTVQVSAGFVGIASYKPVIHGILIAFHTFGGKILLLLHFVWVSSQNRRSLRCYEILCLWWMAQLLLLCVYVVNVALHRHHLFIWSVFAPKLLYEGCHILSLILVTLFFHCIQFLARVLD